MLEEIKKMLITQKEDELSQIREIDNTIKQLNNQESQMNFNDINKKLSDLESQITSLNRHPLIRIFSYKKIKTLCFEYKNILESKMKNIQNFNEKREKLLQQILKLVRNSVKIEREINYIANVKSLKALNINEEQAKKMLREYHHHDDDSTVQKVFLKVMEKHLTNERDIFKIMQKLFQTNSSSFVVEMKSLNPNKLADDLIEIGIIIDKDKLLFLNKLYDYLNLYNIDLPTTDIIQINGQLDNYYCSEIKKLLSNPMIIKNQSSLVFSQIMTLSALVSIAKNNK